MKLRSSSVFLGLLNHHPGCDVIISHHPFALRLLRSNVTAREAREGVFLKFADAPVSVKNCPCGGILVDRKGEKVTGNSLFSCWKDQYLVNKPYKCMLMGFFWPHTQKKSQ